MNYLETIVLALVQGLTEFLPISSSAHLILVPVFMGWEDQGLAFDVAVHLGSLAAVCTYFRGEIVAVFSAWSQSIITRSVPDAEARFGWYIVLATIPTGLFGLLFHDYITAHFRTPLLIAASTAIFGVLLWVVDRHGGVGDDEHTLSWKSALLIGLAQATALVPGVSRSGITITAGLALGLSRPAAARFSFMMAIPIIALASLLEIRNLIALDGPVQWNMIFLGTVISGLAAYSCIRVLLKLLERVSMLPFAIYRVVLGAIIFVLYV